MSRKFHTICISAKYCMCIMFIGLCSCQEGKLRQEEQRVSVLITGVVKRPGKYRVAPNESFTELLNAAGGVQTRVYDGAPRHVHGIEIHRKLDDGSSLYYLWNELDEKRVGRWRVLQNKDNILFLHGPEPIY